MELEVAGIQWWWVAFRGANKGVVQEGLTSRIQHKPKQHVLKSLLLLLLLF